MVNHGVNTADAHVWYTYFVVVIVVVVSHKLLSKI